MTSDSPVSFDTDELILVNDDDVPIGVKSKQACHDGDGLLHRAFSLFLYNDKGELLLQQRSAQKRLWPLFWSNSCCSHPRNGEQVQQAASRRIQQELGVEASLTYLYKFKYQARFDEAGSENELCSVFVGRVAAAIQANSNEVAQWRFVTPAALDLELRDKPEIYTPWLKLEWQVLRGSHREAVEAAIRGS